MKQGLLDETEPDTCCFGAFKIQGSSSRAPLGTQDIIDKLHLKMREKRAIIADYENREREQRLEALYYSTSAPPNMEMARVHMRMSLSAKKMLSNLPLSNNIPKLTKSSKKAWIN